MEDGFRLYIGNLPYVAQRADVKDLFSANSIEVKNIDMSIDPFTGRNPSYCFVDLYTANPLFDRWRQSHEAPAHWLLPHEEGRRLYVGGLPRIDHQWPLDRTMLALFKGWPIETVSKLIWPHPSTYDKPGEHHHCFVDLKTSGSAEQAAQELNGKIGPHGGAYRISVAERSFCSKVVREQFDGMYPALEYEKPAQPRKRDLEINWRRLDASIDHRNLPAMA